MIQQAGHYQGDNCPGKHLPNLVVSGPMRSGKDSVASYLREQYGYTQLTFASHLKEEVARGIGCRPKDLDQEPLRSQVRSVLQVWGTEFRRGQDPEYWVRKMAGFLDGLTRPVQNVLTVGSCPIIVTDARFRNELEMLTGYGFVTVHLNMSGLDVRSYLRAQGKDEMTIARLLAHPSEHEWQSYPFDYVVESTRGQLLALFEGIEGVLRQERR